MDQLAPTERLFALPLLLGRGMGAFPRRYAADADGRRSPAAALAQRPDRSRRGPAHLSVAVAAAVGPCRDRRSCCSASASASSACRRRVKTPFIIGIAGSVAVGKSTTARVLKELLARWPSSPKVDLVTTDGFLYPNEVLRRENLMERKGFPESYDVGALLRFLSAIKAGQPNVTAPLYSHLTYDVLPDEFVDHRPAGHPDLRGHQRAAAARSAEGRQDRAVRVGLLRFLDLYRRRRER